ncbi:MAG: ligase-associated DNA damage response endonuclease PdeM [Alphaproteobacteria bacterium]|nr:ligase-associated DNA damage response endonuclease PdeM [Alphaproteobacteria bacterium]
MTAIEVAGVRLEADPSGALWWADERLLAVADLHLEKGSAFAVRTGQMLPPYDSRATLARLTALAERYQPKTIVCLGDNFHDTGGPLRLDDEARVTLRALMRGRRFVWIEGNHDAGSAIVLGGECTPELALGALRFRHEPLNGAAVGELCGHLHPVARVETRVKRLKRRCFVGDGTRCVLPAFGAYTGGLDVFDVAFAPLFPRGFAAYLLGRDRVYPFAHSKLSAYA